MAEKEDREEEIWVNIKKEAHELKYGEFTLICSIRDGKVRKCEKRNDRKLL